MSPTITELSIQELFQGAQQKKEKMEKYRLAVSLINDNLSFVKEYVPLLTIVAQWTQVLSSINSVTMSKVIFAVRSLKLEIQRLEKRAETLLHGKDETDDSPAFFPSAISRTLGKKMLAINHCLDSNFDHYIAAYDTDGINLSAAYLDPSSLVVLQFEEMKTAEEYLAINFCYESESADTPLGNSASSEGNSSIPAGLMSRISQVGASASSSAGQGGVNIDPRSKFKRECDDYVKKVATLAGATEGVNHVLGINPLQFWSEHANRGSFPILSRLAAVILVMQPTSCDIERLFSLSGNIYNNKRGAVLSDGMGSKLVLAKMMFQENQREAGATTIASRRNATSAASGARLCTLVGNQLVESEVVVDEVEDEDDVAAIIAADNVFERAIFTKAILDCPVDGVKSIPDSVSTPAGSVQIAVYCHEENCWDEGVVHLVNRRVKKKTSDNVSVQYHQRGNPEQEWGMWNHSLHPDNYGNDKDWVLIAPLPATNVPCIYLYPAS